MRISNFSIFRCVLSDKEQTLGEVCAFLGVSNRDIKEKGFRVYARVEDFLEESQSDAVPELCKHASELFAKNRKNITLIKSPSQLLCDGSLVFTPNGDSAFVFLLDYC